MLVLDWDLRLFLFIHTFVGVGGPESCFLPVLVLTHPGQTNIEVFDCCLNETLSKNDLLARDVIHTLHAGP